MAEYLMQEIAISKFKATCLDVLDRVQRTRTPIRVTRFGKPIAEVVPPSDSASDAPMLGAMTGTAQFLGDIVSPASDPGEWDVLKP